MRALLAPVLGGEHGEISSTIRFSVQMVNTAGDAGKITVGLMQFLIPLGGFHYALGFSLQVFDLIGYDLELGINPDIDFAIGFGNLPGQIHQFKMRRQAADGIG